MSTIYSLVCFGGRLGKTVTFTDAGDIVNLTNNGLRVGTGVAFSTTGSLPTGLTAGTTYYAKSGADVNKFLLYPTEADAIAGTSQVTFSGTGSGTHTVKGAYFLGLTTEQLARYGTAGSERIYDGLNAFISGRSSAYFADEEICEIGEAFDDYGSANVAVSTVPAGRVLLTTMVGSARGAGYHGGVVGAGYIFKRPTANAQIILSLGLGNVADGFTVQVTTSPHDVCWAITPGAEGAAQYMIAIGGFNSKGQGFNANSAATIRYCLSIGFRDGYMFTQFNTGVKAYNNVAVSNTLGFAGGNGSGAYQTTNIGGFYYNNISVGNTTNWHAATGQTKATNNAGLSGEAWMVGTGSTRATIATTDFVDVSGTGTAPAWTIPPDFRPAAAASPQVETGTGYYNASAYDIAGNETPRYIGATSSTVVNAGAFVTNYAYVIETVGTTDFTAIGASANTVGIQFKATGAGAGTGTATATEVRDIGPYEFDHGYGPHPASHTLTLDSVVVGSRILIESQDGATQHHNDTAATSSVEITVPVYGDDRDDWRIRIRKASGTPYYRPWTTLITAAAGESAIYVEQQLDE